MPPQKPTRILLADDDEDDREFFRLALENVNKNVQLFEVPNGLQAVRFLSDCTELPHFVFLDINMPLVNGVECLKQARKLHPPGLLPVIMLSTSGAPDIIKECMSLGADLYLQKPGSLEELSAQIQRCIARRRPGPFVDQAAFQDR